MERNEIILTVVLSTVAALVSMGLTFLLCHWCSRRKRKRRTDELDSLQSILSPDAASNDKKNGAGSGVNHGGPMESDSKNNSKEKTSGCAAAIGGAGGALSTLKLKTPNIRTKGVGAQLENESLVNHHSDGSNNVQHQQPGSKNSAPGTKDQGHQYFSTRSLSQIDMFIDQSESNDNCGQLQFSLEYDFQASTLIIKIIQAKGIPAMDLSGTSDPYVRVTLLPDKKHRLETKIKRRTLHPRWNETFYFEGFPIQKLQSRVLHLHVFDYDRFSRDDSIGEVYLPLCQVDLSEKPVFWKALKAPIKDKCGEILVSLCYHPTTSELTLVIVKARNLKAKDINGKSDPYVKVWLQHGEKKVEKKKTCIIKRTLDPVYNETFVFAVPWEKLRETSLLVQVMDFDSVGRNELIGKILLCAKGGVTESKHWNEMINKPRQTVLMWHRLKPE
ncbi:Synaptotagmin-7 [Chamberlinius hualienensis]